MATLFTHPAVALALRPWLSSLPAQRSVLLGGVLLTMLPDADVVSFVLRIPYEHMLGHRGLSHSILFAVLAGFVFAWLLRQRAGFAALWGFGTVCCLSHSVLDAMTSGGLGVAWLAPFSNERFFLPWRPIRVSPIGVGFFSPRGVVVILSELVWVWLPCLLVMAVGRVWRKRQQMAPDAVK